MNSKRFNIDLSPFYRNILYNTSDIKKGKIMSILTVENLQHGFGDRTILEDVNFRLLYGEHVGLIGANGEGKSTFLNIITGQLQPDEGKIEWAKDIRIGYLDQHAKLTAGLSIRDVLRQAFAPLLEKNARLEEIYILLGEADDKTMPVLLDEMGELQTTLEHSDFFNIDQQIDEIAAAFGLDAFGLDTDVTELSGGQRTKILLAKLLLSRPDILFLDEPTNYLDLEHIQWLEDYLNNYENAFILISHDIPFLNRVVNLIYHVEQAKLTRYVGNYETFQELYAMHKAHQEAAYERQQKEIAGLKDFVARNKARVATRNMAMSRQKKLEKMDVIELTQEKPDPVFVFTNDRTPSRVIFETKDLVIGYGEALSSPINLKLERGQKICLVGANGIGKTTLLKSLIGEIPAFAGAVEKGDFLSIAYFEQEATRDLDRTCIEDVWEEYPQLSQFEVRSALAKCGLTTKHIESRVGVLSGGEQAKLRLCKLILKPNNVLVLDEPTNHLDPQAKEALLNALKDYKGTLLMVCHEPEFYEALGTEIWNGHAFSLKKA